MKTAKLIAIISGSIPIIGWLVSIPYNEWALGAPFTVTGEWNNLPLWVVTAPLNRLAEILFDTNWFPEHRYFLVLIYTPICSILYAIFGWTSTMCLKYVIRKLKRTEKT